MRVLGNASFVDKFILTGCETFTTPKRWQDHDPLYKIYLMCKSLLFLQPIMFHHHHISLNVSEIVEWWCSSWCKPGMMHKQLFMTVGFAPQIINIVHHGPWWHYCIAVDCTSASLSMNSLLLIVAYLSFLPLLTLVPLHMHTAVQTAQQNLSYCWIIHFLNTNSIHFFKVERCWPRREGPNQIRSRDRFFTHDYQTSGRDKVLGKMQLFQTEKWIVVWQTCFFTFFFVVFKPGRLGYFCMASLIL